jgi:hypothetical protein
MVPRSFFLTGNDELPAVVVRLRQVLPVAHFAIDAVPRLQQHDPQRRGIIAARLRQCPQRGVLVLERLDPFTQTGLGVRQQLDHQVVHLAHGHPAVDGGCSRSRAAASWTMGRRMSTHIRTRASSTASSGASPSGGV